MIKYFFLIITVYIFAVACTKENDRKYCWHLYDMLRNRLDDVCDKTKAEMEALYGNACYEREDEKVECWKVENVDEILSGTESFIHFFYVKNGLSAQKHQCVPCENWYIREKRVFKPDNTYALSNETFKRFCGDTLSTLFPGRNIIIREVTDSVIYIQFSKDRIVWE